MYIHRRNEKDILGKLPEHPSRIHGAQEASSTSSSLGPERLQQGVPYNGHKKLMTTSDLRGSRAASACSGLAGSSVQVTLMLFRSYSLLDWSTINFEWQ